jgi:hypothetical protein
MAFRILITVLLISSFITSAARPVVDSIPAQSKDVQSIDAIIHALYNVISGDAGVKRDWNRMRSLFLPEGRLISTGVRNDSIRYRVLTPDDYIKLSGPVLEKNGFHEREIGRKTEVYGHIAHVFSTYESKHTMKDEKPFMRGINSIQLMYDGKRWWIVSVYWNSETPANPIPEKYLKAQ